MAVFLKASLQCVQGLSLERQRAGLQLFLLTLRINNQLMSHIKCKLFLVTEQRDKVIFGINPCVIHDNIAMLYILF